MRTLFYIAQENILGPGPAVIQPVNPSDEVVDGCTLVGSQGGDLWDVGSGVIHVGPSLTSPQNIKYSCPCRRPSALDSHAGGIDSSALIGCERGQQRLGGGLQYSLLKRFESHSHNLSEWFKIKWPRIFNIYLGEKN